MKVFAHARHLRMSPRKVRLIADLVRGLDVSSARRQLMVSKKAASDIVLKLLNSAAANAEHNFGIAKEQLRIKSIEIGEGPTLKRWRPRSRGMASHINKRTAHIKIVLELLPSMPKKEKEAVAVKTSDKGKEEKPEVVKKLEIKTQKDTKKDTEKR